MEKVNFPESTLFYLNQAYLTVKKKKIYCDFFILGQIVESSNPPQNVSSYTLKENEVKMVRPRYHPKSLEFKGLYGTIGYLVVRGSPEEVFLIMVMIVKNQNFFILTTEGEFQTLSAGPYSTTIG